MTDELKTLLDKLAAAKFSGELRLRFEGGALAAATLKHFLPFAELGRELPGIHTPAQKPLEFTENK